MRSWQKKKKKLQLWGLTGPFSAGLHPWLNDTPALWDWRLTFYQHASQVSLYLKKKKRRSFNLTSKGIYSFWYGSIIYAIWVWQACVCVWFRGNKLFFCVFSNTIRLLHSVVCKLVCKTVLHTKDNWSPRNKDRIWALIKPCHVHCFLQIFILNHDYTLDVCLLYVVIHTHSWWAHWNSKCCEQHCLSVWHSTKQSWGFTLRSWSS